jgi:hypothetical protein
MNNSNPIWWKIQNDGLEILNALLKYGYQFKGLVTNDSKTKKLDQMHDLLCDVALNPTWRHIQDGGLDIFNVLL